MRTAGTQQGNRNGSAMPGEVKPLPESALQEPAASRLRSRMMPRIMAMVILGLGLFALIERGGAVEWLFAAVAVLAAGGGLLLPYAALGRIHAERIVYDAENLEDGGEMRAALTIRLSRMLPFMWVCVQEEIANACAPQGSGIHIMRALLPGFSRRLTLTYKVNGLLRGELEFRRLTVTAGDMLGLTVRTVVVACPGHAIVRPSAPAGEELGELPGFEAAQARQGMQPVSAFGGQMMAAASRLRRDGAGPELRGYIPGDSLRRVDWRAMARGLGMQTRMSEAAEAGTVIIMLETSASAYGKERRLFDANAGRAAAMMKRAVREGKSVKLLTNSAAESLIFDGAAGADLREAEIRLAKLRLDEAFKPMSQRLSDVVAGAPRGASVICLTAGMTGSAEAIARPSSDPGNITYGAKLAGVRGIQLLLLLSVPADKGDAAAESWRERLQGTGCLVRAMPMPKHFGSMKPGVEDAAVRSGREGGGVHVEAAGG
ncbi:DUF58 domain-containing protein [Paenibacillus rhizovicinus]|uniref:DUF58 domain-containing protein n=1 Tax=Paenibacillus rhizovicinus TaxID=2704463 RepID=A0A6C0NZ40_9BACL|nr:DUF58 domain-containing protein [Paenibacillus rhizovicinus]QHW31505.1 DUF58 domain-containing protein [Paenibacillus rhizovicinus]